jgi:peptidyl-prolyl cis-trans isomerase D
MLQTMRHLAQSWIFKTLMLFLVISFSIWGIGDIFRGNPLQRTVAKSGKMSITVQVLDHAFEQALARARQMFGPDLTPEQARQMGLLDQTLDNLIEHADIEQDVDKLGIDVSDQTLLDQLAMRPQFRDKDGHFDKKLLRQMVANSGMSERGFLDTARKEMAQQQLFDALQSDGKIPQTIVDNIYRARGQKRILDVVTVKNASFTDIPAPDAEVLNAFYQQNAAKFVAPEYRGLTIAILSTDDLAKDITISDEDLKKEYDTRATELARPERRDLVQVVLQDEGAAKQLASAAKSGGNLAAAAKSKGHDAVPLDQVDQKTLLPELAKSAFALQAGQVSEPIKSSLGWHVVQVKKIYAAGTPDFDSAKDQLRVTMKHDQAIESATRLVNQLDDQLAAGHALEDIADGMKLRLVKIPAVDANGKMPDGADPVELPDREDVLKAAFGQASGETSPVLDDRKGDYIVVRTDEVATAAVPPFDKIKDRVTAEWKAAEQAKRSEAEADQIVKAMRDGKPAASFAAQKGVEVRVSKPVSLLGDTDADLPQTVLPQVFKMKKGEVVAMPLPDRQLILRLTDLVDADPAGNAAWSRVAGELQGQMPNELTDQYIKYLRVIFPVEIDRNLLDSLRQQGG